VMTCVFTSCGDEKKDESSVSDNVSVSVQDETESSAEESSDSDSEPTYEIQNTSHEYLDDADPTAFLGKWECEKIIVNGEEMADVMGMPVYAVYQYDIMENGTVGMSDSLMEIATEEDNFDYTWGMISETEIEIVNPDGKTMPFTLDGDYLVDVDSDSGMEIYLKKVDEFTPFDYKNFVDNYQSQQNQVVLTPVETDADGNIIESSETVTAE
ncbi:MAG: hypothetical protein K2G14_07000, partial [Ruminococcus sp.]|nr:hypothetical protein [Ruminococcus sp.]